jgi:hypothetical protein
VRAAAHPAWSCHWWSGGRSRRRARTVRSGRGAVARWRIPAVREHAQRFAVLRRERVGIGIVAAAGRGIVIQTRHAGLTRR